MIKKSFYYVLISILILIVNINISNATQIKQGEYLEKNQWGALEDLLIDLNNSKISTNQCALYGCYILIALEPLRNDRNDYIKLIPSRYDLSKKSKSPDPFFFIKFLYENKRKFNKITKKAFDNSEWSVFEILDNFKNNSQIKKIIKTTPKIAGHDFGSQCIPFKIIGREIIKKQIMSTEEIYIVAKLFVHNNDYATIFKEYINYFWNNSLTPPNMIENAYFIKLYIDHVSKTNNRKIIKIINFLNYGYENEFFKIKYNKLQKP